VDLSPGLYLVAQADIESSEYIVAPYLVYVSGEHVTALPKTEPVKRGEKTYISVYKVWAGTITPPGSILVQLYRNGVPYGNCVTLGAGNHWSYTWDNIDPKETWAVDEFDVAEGYAKTISGSASAGFVVTNTRSPHAPQRIPLSGKKTWEHGSNPIDKRPVFILLRVYANGVFILQKQIGAAEHWSWSILVDKYDKDGKEIVYTVDEAPVDEYIKAIDGYDILDIHKSYEGPPKLNLPKTDDLNNLPLWLAGAAIGFAGLGAVIIILWRNKRREKICS